MKSEHAVAGMGLELFNPDHYSLQKMHKSEQPRGGDSVMMMGMGISNQSLNAKAAETIGKKIGDFLPALDPYCLNKMASFSGFHSKRSRAASRPLALARR